MREIDVQSNATNNKENTGKNFREKREKEKRELNIKVQEDKKFLTAHKLV